MDYGNLLRRSWHVTWQHKFLIVLGFLASLGSGVGSSNFNYSMDSGDLQSFPFTPGDPNLVLPALGALAAGTLCFALILGIAFWILQLTAEAGLIDAAYRLDAGQKSDFRSAMSAGWQKIWSMVGLNILLFGSIFLILAVLAIVGGLSFAGIIGGAMAGGEEAGAAFAGLGIGILALICCLLCGLAILGIVVSVLYLFAQRALVLEDQGVIDAIRRGWQVIRDNLAEVIILLVLFLVIGILVGIVTAIIFIPLGIFSVGPTALRVFSGEQVGGFDIALMVLGGLIMIAVSAAIRAIYTSFHSSAFTLAFKEFTEKQLPGPDKLGEQI